MNKTEKGKYATLINRVLKTQTFEEYERRKFEQTRIGIALQVAEGKMTETTDDRGFKTSTGEGEDEKDRVNEEEYCYGCEKIITETDDRKP